MSRGGSETRPYQDQFILKSCTRTNPSGTVRKPESLALCAHSQWRWKI